MLVFGKKSVTVATDQPNNFKCLSCGTQGSVKITVFSKHFHLFWIPTFPIGKSGVSVCNHCKQQQVDKDMPSDLRVEYQRIKQNGRAPIWQFSGLGIFPLLILFGIYMADQDKKQEQIYLSSPAAGDIYMYKTEASYYSTLKVISVDDDSVYVSPNTYETTKMSGISDIDKDENYPEYIYGISKEEVQQMYQESTIYDIRRD